MDNKHLNILMIEDLEAAQRVAFNIFKEINCKSTIVSNANRAIEQLLTQSFDIIFIDIQLPDMNGFELAQTIRGLNKRSPAIPLIAVTANATEDFFLQARTCGFNDFIMKPLTIESIRNALAMHLNRQTPVLV